MFYTLITITFRKVTKCFGCNFSDLFRYTHITPQEQKKESLSPLYEILF